MDNNKEFENQQGINNNSPNIDTNVEKHFTPSNKRKYISRKPVVAGTLLIIVGIFGIIFSSMIIGGGLLIDDIDDLIFEGMSITSIEGKITDESGNPLDGAKITIMESHLSATTDEYGNYTINGIPMRYHQIKIEKEGFNTVIYNTFIIRHDEVENSNNQKNDLKVYFNTSTDDFDFQMSEGSDTYTYGSTRSPINQFMDKFGGWIAGFGVITLICSVLSVIGGYFSIRRKNYAIALLCSIAAIFSFGFFIGSMLAIIALIILILASDEFNSKNNSLS